MDNFNAQALPEISPPSSINGCQKCELHEHKNAGLVWAEGNPVGQIFVVLDNPGARMNNLGEPFVCGTRETLQRAIFDAGLNVNNVFITYLLKCRPTKKYNKEQSRLVCKNYLLDQIKYHNPRLICCLGNIAVQSYFNDPTLTVKELRGSCYEIDNIKTVVSYHPLAVRRRPVLYKYFLEDWIFIAKEVTKM